MEFISSVPIYAIVLSLLAIIVILSVTLIITLNNSRKLKKIMTNCSSGKLDETIGLYYDKIENLTEELRQKEERFALMEKMIGSGIQKFAALRYNAFDDISNNLSFSLALLDAFDNGFIITSIYGRESSNVYIKSVINGKSRYHMSNEETLVFEKALEIYENKLKRGMTNEKDD